MKNKICMCCGEAMQEASPEAQSNLCPACTQLARELEEWEETNLDQAAQQKPPLDQFDPLHLKP